MREMYYSSQPMEMPRRPLDPGGDLQDDQCRDPALWSSDYPHWDFDLPSAIYDLPFLNEQAKRNILGGNAAKLFGLDTRPVKKFGRANGSERVHAGTVSPCGSFKESSHFPPEQRRRQ